MNDYIYIKDLLINGSFPEGGAKLYDLAKPIMETGGTIKLNFDGVDALPSLFMNVSFGKLIPEFGIRNVVQSLKFYDISKVQLEHIRRYFKRFNEAN